MGTVPRITTTSLSDYTVEELEALEREWPELGRVELIDGALHATGESAMGIPHQIIMQRLHLLLTPLCPTGLLVMLDTWWHYVRPDGRRGKIRADVGIYRVEDLPDAGKVFLRPPVAVVEILSDDALHDLASKDEIYAQHSAQRAYIDPDQRYGWWWRADGNDVDGALARWVLDGWPSIELDKARLLAPASGGV